ncbi:MULTISPECIES: CatB-related O-acetyltransferase [unclassified Alistipes]|jgi:acetyltransferase-like isoleucine patch superfamily enzyme|uniref:CatB-related O-acetyltransferase n=1 Tax=unclassified Alistipes TaxID=2608932 RepID=UPI000E5470BC|nr:antibiotic acetyltransferase [Alistipes sp. AF48-12]
MFSFLYRCLKNRHAHRILLRIIARSGGGLAFSSEVRKLYAEVHRIRIGYGTYGGCFDTENIPPDVSFGNYCSIASGVRIFRANHPSGRFTTHPILYNPVMGYVEKDMLERPPLEIGHDVWIGANAIILPGVSRIGNGAVIGAGSVVTKDVGPYEIVAGNPARTIRKRFDERQITALENCRWWELDRHELADRIGELDALLQSPENPK